MVYLDYSATTKMDEEVLNTYNKVVNNFFANTNSLHILGIESKLLLNESLKQIASYVNCHSNEIIITSGATEANNLAIKGILGAYPNRGKKVLTTNLEHASIKNQTGVDFEKIKLDENGSVDFESLKEKLTDEVILVSIVAVDSELGIKQDIEQIAKLLKNYPLIKFHVDATQAIGKVDINYSDVDLISLSAHKIYGSKGIGALICKNNTKLSNQIEGGASITSFRGGTPPLELIVAFAKAIKLVNENKIEKYNHVKNLNEYLLKNLQDIKNITINNTKMSIPHIVNISLNNIKPEPFVHALEQDKIYISTKSACSFKEDISLPVYEITNDLNRAKNSIRISISFKTTKEEIDLLVDSIKKNLKKLNLRGDYE